MLNFFLNWYKENISPTYTAILIAFFFSNSINFYTTSRQYNNEQKAAVMYKELKQRDSLSLSLENTNDNLRKKVALAKLLDSVSKVNDRRANILYSSIFHYENNDRPKDSTDIFVNNLKIYTHVIPFEIGEIDAFKNLDLQEMNSRRLVVLDDLRSELEVLKDLLKFYENKNEINDETNNKIEELKISSSALITYSKDSLHTLVLNDKTENLELQFSKFEKNIASFESNFKMYNFLFLLSLGLSILFFIIALRLKHFKRN